MPYLNERMLYQFHWGYRKDGRSLDEFKAWAQRELRPVLHRVLQQATAEEILEPRAAYGYWPCAAEGNDVVIFSEDGRREVARLSRAAAEQHGTHGQVQFVDEACAQVFANRRCAAAEAHVAAVRGLACLRERGKTRN